MITPPVEEIRRWRWAQGAFFTCSFVMALVFLALFPRLSLPIASAYVIALVLGPLRDRLRALPSTARGAAWLAILLAVVLLGWSAAHLIDSLVYEIAELARNLPRLEPLLREKYAVLRAALQERFGVRIDLDPVAFIAPRLTMDLGRWLVIIPKILGNVLEWAILTPVFTWFFLIEGQRLKQGFLQLVPNQWFERVYMLFFQFNSRFGGYIIAKGVEATILGLLLLAGLVAINYPYASLLALAGGLTNIVPYVGPVLGWGAALVVGLVQQPLSPEALGAMTAIYAVANFIDVALVFPLLVSRIVNLHPLLVVISVIVGGEAAGLVGMIISVPVVTFVKLVLGNLHQSIYLESQR